ncbi:DRTGG domain-containing protein [Chloroflexota bacterium]
MASLYIASMSAAGGKTALCVGLGEKLKARGKRVGFLKPLITLSEGTSVEGGDKDAEFMKQTLVLEESLEVLCPASSAIKEGYAKVSKDKDVVLIEGTGDCREGSDSVQTALQLVKDLAAKVVLIARYESDLEVDKIVALARAFTDQLFGVVVNAVPELKMEHVNTSLVPALEQQEIKVLGVLPEDRELLTISVGELAECLEGNILNNSEHGDDLVESLMVGALSVDPAPSYLNLKENKAVITRGDRPDIQLAALEGSTKCLVLTNDIEPVPMILSRAQEREIPVVAVKTSTLSAMEAVEDILKKSRFHQEKKLKKLGELLDKHFDLETLYSAA